MVGTSYWIGRVLTKKVTRDSRVEEARECGTHIRVPKMSTSWWTSQPIYGHVNGLCGRDQIKDLECGDGLCLSGCVQGQHQGALC